MLLHKRGGFTAQKFAIAFWPGVRVEPVAAPRALTSLKSIAYCRLVSSFGPFEPYRDGSAITNGVTSLSHAFGSLACAGTSGRHWPGRVPGENRNAPPRPSRARAASIASAAAAPTAIPPSFEGPSGTASSEAMYADASVAGGDTSTPRSTWYAALAT